MSYRREIRGFRGLLPRIEHRLLERNYATKAVDCRFVDGTVTNLPLPTLCNHYSQTVTDLPMVDACPCLLSDGGTVATAMHGNNILMTESIIGGVQVGTAEELCSGYSTRLSFKPPTTQPMVSFNADDGCPRYTAYMYTHLYIIGNKVYESSPSPATDIFRNCGSPVELVFEAVDHPRFAGYSVYRSEAGYKQGQEKETDTNAAWVHVDDTPSNTYTDVFTPGQVNPSSPYLFERGMCPEDMKSIGVTDDGIYFGLSGDSLWYTLPGQPDTFHPRRKRTISAGWGNPVLAVAHRDTIYVFTDKHLVMYETRLGESGPTLNRTLIYNVPLASARSVAVSHAGVMFSSMASLLLLSGGKVTDIGGRWWNPNQWRNLSPETMMGAIHHNAYLLVTSHGTFLLTFGDGLYENEDFGDLTNLDMGGIFTGIVALRGSVSGFRFASHGNVMDWSHTNDAVGRHGMLLYRTSVNDNNHSQSFTAMEIHCKDSPSFDFRYYETNTDCGDKLIKNCHVSGQMIFSVRPKREDDTFMEVEGRGTLLSVNCATSKFALRRDSGASNE